MGKSHLILKNPISDGNGIRLNCKFYDSKKDDNDDDDKNYEFQVQKIHNCQEQFYSNIRIRHSKRDLRLEIPHYDYIRINFFKPFKDPVSTWGLKEISVSNMGLSVLFLIENEYKFHKFMEILNDLVENVELIKSNKKYTLINSFELFDSRSMGVYLGNSSNLIINLVPEDSVDGYRQIINSLVEYLGDNKIRKISDSYSYSEMYEIDVLPEKDVIYIKDNFDIIQQIQSIPLYKVAPNVFNKRNFFGIFNVDLSRTSDLPVIGLIDSGINLDISAFNELVVKQVSIIEEPVVIDEYHGTSVASLIVFGKQNLTERLIPQAKIYSIQVYRKTNNKFSLLDLKNAIITAYREYDVRIFNISMSAELSKDINSDISIYAKMLDELSYKYNILFVIATGNSDDINEDIPYIYYDPCDPNNTQNKNIGEPGDCMNGITVGAMFNKVPTLYTKKSYIDFSMKVEDAYIGQGAVNDNLHKPDVLIDGGKDCTSENGILVLGPDRANQLGYLCGTSMATPYISNLCAQIIIQQRRRIPVSTLKALVINSVEPSKLIDNYPQINEIATKRTEKIKKDTYCKDYNHLKEKTLSKMIEGHGIVDEAKTLFSDDNNVTIIIEEKIKDQQVLFMKLKLPELLKDGNAKGNILKIYSTLCFTIPTSRYTDPINYDRYFISYKFINTNESEDNILNEIVFNKDDKTKDKDKGIHIKGTLDRWSDNFKYVSNKAFSNVNNIDPFLIRQSDLLTTDNKIGIAFRCVNKDKIDTPIDFSFCMRIELINEKLLESGISLYDELCAENNLIAINENIAEATASLDV